MPLTASHCTTHNVSLPMTPVGVNSKQPVGSTVVLTTVPVLLVLPSHNVVVTILPGPNGLSRHNVSTHVLHTLSIIVSVGAFTVI